MAAAPGAVVRALAKALQVAQGVVARHDDRPAATAVAPVGTAARHVRFAAKARSAVSPGSRPDVDARAIVKHVGPS